jgi:UTP--glucose-1-phosphate uridylyltransferase
MIAIIPAAGLGTRFLPFTKSVPKELLPIGARPAIEYIVQEALNNDIHALNVVINEEKAALKHHLTQQPALNNFLIKHNKLHLIEPLNELLCNSTVSFSYQKDPLGLGHAVLCAQSQVAQTSHVVVMLPDELLFDQTGSSSMLLKNMQKIAAEQKASVIAVSTIPKEKTSSYGIVDIIKTENGLLSVRCVVEKPQPANAPSNLAIIGRYVLEYGIFDALANTKPGALGEIQLTDAIALMIRQGRKVIAYECTDQRFDIGSPAGWLEANIFKQSIL